MIATTTMRNGWLKDVNNFFWRTNWHQTLFCRVKYSLWSNLSVFVCESQLSPGLTQSSFYKCNIFHKVNERQTRAAELSSIGVSTTPPNFSWSSAHNFRAQTSHEESDQNLLKEQFQYAPKTLQTFGFCPSEVKWSQCCWHWNLLPLQ